MCLKLYIERKLAPHSEMFSLILSIFQVINQIGSVLAQPFFSLAFTLCANSTRTLVKPLHSGTSKMAWWLEALAARPVYPSSKCVGGAWVLALPHSNWNWGRLFIALPNLPIYKWVWHHLLKRFAS